MNATTTSQPLWVPLEKIQHILGIETFALLWTIFPLCFLFYYLFLKKISPKRHHNLQIRFRQFPYYLGVATFLTIFHYGLIEYFPNNSLILKSASYLALAALLIGAVAIIKLSQIIIYLYLFFSNMSHGVPKLIANMFTFIFSLFILNMIASHVFQIHLVALLATSAVFSLVLGLALQDTLGNLFSGVALQIESPFKIGDWIEVNSGHDRMLGQVQEVTWRATFLLSFSDELIMIPNRMIAQSQIIIISQGSKNIRLNQVFRFPHDTDIEKAKSAILEGISEVEGIMTDPPVRILITETSESFLAIKAIYSLVDFSTRYRTGDKIISRVYASIKRNQLKLQVPSIEIHKKS